MANDAQIGVYMIFTADEKNVMVYGRTLWYSNIRYLNYSCSAIEFTFTGTRAQARLWTDSHKYEDSQKAWMAVFINGEETPSKRFPLEQEEMIYMLYEGEEVKEITLRLVKYSEAAFGKVGVKEITTDGPLFPKLAPKKQRKLEFIGDSITCGYGNEGIWNVDSFSTTEENPWEAYAAVTARALGADYHLISWSGIGIISNWTDQEEPNNDWLMPNLYPYTDKAMDLALNMPELEIWDHSRFIPDCIIINLGTNDSSYTKDIPERVEDFGRAYYKFIKNVRKNNPQSKILCTLGAMGQNLCPEIKRQVELLQLEGEDQLYFMEFEVQDVKDGIGSDWHPSKTTHQKMAAKLVAGISRITGW